MCQTISAQLCMPPPLQPRLIGYELLEQKAKLVTDRQPAGLQHERPFLIATAFVQTDAAKFTRSPAAPCTFPFSSNCCLFVGVLHSVILQSTATTPCCNWGFPGPARSRAGNISEGSTQISCHKQLIFPRRREVTKGVFLLFVKIVCPFISSSERPLVSGTARAMKKVPSRQTPPKKK